MMHLTKFSNIPRAMIPLPNFLISLYSAVACKVLPLYKRGAVDQPDPHRVTAIAIKLGCHVCKAALSRATYAVLCVVNPTDTLLQIPKTNI